MNLQVRPLGYNGADALLNGFQNVPTANQPVNPQQTAPIQSQRTTRLMQNPLTAHAVQPQQYYDQQQIQPGPIYWNLAHLVQQYNLDAPGRLHGALPPAMVNVQGYDHQMPYGTQPRQVANPNEQVRWLGSR